LDENGPPRAGSAQTLPRPARLSGAADTGCGRRLCSGRFAVIVPQQNEVIQTFAARIVHDASNVNTSCGDLDDEEHVVANQANGVPDLNRMSSGQSANRCLDVGDDVGIDDDFQGLL